MDETSLEIVHADQMYPKQPFTSDDGVTTVPFSLLSGENPLYRGKTAEGLLILTSYRLYHTERTCINLPLGLIDYIECKEIVYLYIYSKDGRSFRCLFLNNEETQRWLRRIQECIKLPDKIDHCFALRFLSWAREEQKDDIVSQARYNFGALLDASPLDDFTAEAERMGFDLKSAWKITRVNEDFQLCPSYPRYMVVPAPILDENMKDLANFRYSKRIPAVVWRHQQNGCVIARSSQPKMGILSWRNANDEKLIDAIYLACDRDPGFAVASGDDAQHKGQGDSDTSVVNGQTSERKPEKKPDKKKLLIVDARSFAAAMTNRAKGGGYECDGYYQNCEIEYMGLANIHTIRNSFNCLRSLCAVDDDQNWLSSLESTKWLQYISGLIRSALVVVDAVDLDKRPVLVHCSDGWDRTPQIVALAEIMLDPYYRTKKGFQVLVEREWLEFGHKFADRCGNPDGTEDRNERSPVFLQWLDCIYQLLRQFQCHFEFNEQYLARLILHTYSCLFGTFLCNTDEDRKKERMTLRTFSVWPVLNEKSQFHNYLYNHSTEVLRPSYQIRSLKFWSDVYLANSSISLGRPTIPPAEEPLPAPNEERSTTNLVKTKSCDNIHSAEHPEALKRRKSDTNLAENSFTETVHYPQIPDFTADVERLPNTTLGDINVRPIAGDSEDFDVENNNLVVRTDVKSLDITTKSNLVLREPNIDGSTDTLVSESGAVIQEQCRDGNPTESSVCSVATDTSDLVKEDVLLPQNTHYVDNGLSNWSQNVIEAYLFNKKNDVSNNSCSCSYTTPAHSRTPSSGFPATPCDDPSDMPNLKRDSPACQIMDFDGLNLLPDAVQDRIKKLILHYKNKVGNLNLELSAARCERLQFMCRQYRGKENNSMDGDDAPSLADSASSGDHHAESGGSESSWDLLCSPDHGAANLGMGM